MKIKLLKEDGSFFDGIIVIYKDYIEVMESNDFYNLSKILSHKHKLNESDVLSESIHLFYHKENEEVFIKERRREDLVRLSKRDVKETFRFIGEAFS